MNKFYITTAIPYVNGKPHIGHTLEYFQADVIRRYHQILGDETLLLSGADENALKNVQAAQKEGIPIKQFLDDNSKLWQNAYEKLGVHLDVFQRSSDQQKHWPGVQKFWNLCVKNGDIYKKSYAGLYCVGCEGFKLEKELINGLCPTHQKAPEKISEENYFFKLSNYQDKLTELIESGKLKITPSNKREEALSFIKQGLEDFSVSRSKQRAQGVGVPVPGDANQVMYVWFDALNIYMTGVGYGWDEEKWQKWWPADLHVIGKDINRFHTVYWPAMLLSAGLPLPKEILIHGFVYTKGEKMSKSIGNVIDPFEFTKEYGVEALRYFLLSQIPIDADGDFTLERFKEVYNADLANGLGNLISRMAKLCETANFRQSPAENNHHVINDFDKYKKLLSEYRFNETLNLIWGKITKVDQYINEEKPWELLKTPAGNLKRPINIILGHAVDEIEEIAELLEPFLPETSAKIKAQFTKTEIKSFASLFPRIT
ncbi:MAG: methionine--tRNA ligase [Candidatus Levyibacteriota bacterium]|jgi:methionyl-tRNA synthetase